MLRKEYLSQRRQMRIWRRLLLRIAFIVACLSWLITGYNNGYFSNNSDSLFIVSSLVTMLFSSLIIALEVTEFVGDGITILIHRQPPALFKTISITLGTIISFYILGCIIIAGGVIDNYAEDRWLIRYLWETSITLLNGFILFRLATRQLQRLRKGA